MKYINTILEGDCVKILENIKNDSISFILFSPPYNNIRDYKGDWNLDLSALGSILYNKIKEGGVCTVVISDGTRQRAKSMTTFRMAVDWTGNIGWKMFESVIYHRHGRPGAWWSSRFRVDHEHILIFFKGNAPNHFDKTHLAIPSKHAGKEYTGTQRKTDGGLDTIKATKVKDTKCRGTVWHYATSNSEGNPLKMKHPATFPDDLARDLILCFTRKDDLVLDPMCGSGTTCVVAAQEGRRYTGIDFSSEYCNIARKRIDNEK